jgi:hypothetical protein
VALKGLEALLSSFDVDALKQALEHAASLSLQTGAVYSAASRRFEAITAQHTCMGKLNEVLITCRSCGEGNERQTCIDSLGDALEAASAACESSRVEDCVAGLLALISEGNIQLQALEGQARASRLLRNSRKHSTATGLTERDQQDILRKLKLATDRYDARNIAIILGEASRNGLSASDLAPHKAIFQQLQSEQFVRQRIAETRKEMQSPQSDTLHCWRLMNLSDQLQALGGDSETVRAARLSVTVAARRITLTAGHEQDFGSAFDDIRKFPGLRPNAVMQHQLRSLKGSLTNLHPADEKEALRNFRNIQTWMADRSATDSERQAAGDAIVRLLRVSDELHDEIYAQVVKQLINNPSLRSVALGWELLIMLTKSMVPSDQFYQFFKGFLNTMAADKTELVSKKSQQCLHQMEELNKLPRIEGYIYKSRPAKVWTRKFDKRYVVVRDMHVYWYKSEQDASGAESASSCGSLHI